MRGRNAATQPRLNPHRTMTTRNGKIARRPKAVRHELKCRISEGEPGASLVGWLNERDDEKTVLADPRAKHG